MNISSDECAREVLEVVPLIMRAIRMEMRGHRTPDLSVPQFRTLAFVGRHPGTALGDVAGHVGLTPPSMSAMIDGLVARGLVIREISSADRRRVTLTLTAAGEALLVSARGAAEARLAERLAALPAAERMVVAQAMRTLRPLFMPGYESKSESGETLNVPGMGR